MEAVLPQSARASNLATIRAREGAALLAQGGPLRGGGPGVAAAARSGSNMGAAQTRSAGTRPTLPGEDWQRIYPRLTGICGSDLATIDGQSSRYFEDYVSFPFVPGHEIVADTTDGRRVIVEPVMGHASRGFDLPYPGAAPGDGDDYRHLMSGHLKPGLQIGFCKFHRRGLVHRTGSPRLAAPRRSRTG